MSAFSKYETIINVLSLQPERFTVAITTWLTVTEYLCHKWLRICSTSRFFPHSWLITKFVTRVTPVVATSGAGTTTLPEHLYSPPIFIGVRVTRVVFCWSLFDLLSFFFWPLCCLITPLLSSNSS